MAQYRGMRSGGIKALGVLTVVAGCVLTLTSAGATTPTDLTWNGTNAVSNQASTADRWSQANWTTPSPAENQSVGRITFPSLGSCQIGVDACYSSNDDIPGIDAQAVTVDDGDTYVIQGDQLSVGSGGFTAAPPSSTSDGAVSWEIPVVLTADQSWTLGGTGTYEHADFELSSVSGNHAVDATLSGEVIADLGDTEIGAFTATGANSTKTGINAVQNGAVTPTTPESLNATTGSPLTLDDVLLNAILQGNQSIGPLTSHGAFVEVGNGNAPDTLLTVKGGVSLDAKTMTQFGIDASGTTPSTDYSQLSATGAVKLGGTLSVAGSCTIGTGSTDTLIKTTGTLSGQFANAPEGSVIPFVACSSPALAARINYTAHTMTATVVKGATTTTALTAASASVQAGKPVSLTAAVTAGTALMDGPAGTVKFLDGTHVIAGCSAKALTPTSASAGTASCSGPLPTATSPAPLTAVFTPSSHGLNGSTSKAVSVTVTSASKASLGKPKASGHTAKVPVTCTGKGSCKVTVTLREKTKGHAVVGKKSATIKAGDHTTLSVSLTKAGKKVLTKKHKLAVTVTLTTASSTASKSVTFKT